MFAVPFSAIPLFGNAKAIRFPALEAICRVLECQPGDVLEYLDNKDYKNLKG